MRAAYSDGRLAVWMVDYSDEMRDAMMAEMKAFVMVALLVEILVVAKVEV